MYGICKFFSSPRLKLLNVHLKQKGKSLLKKTPKQNKNKTPENTENYVSFLWERILQN